jgi:hypothetical protein
VDVGSQRARSGDRHTGESWGGALWKAALLLVLAWLGFLYVPNRLLAYLSTRVTPHARDALVTLWVVAFFAALSWLFVALQRRGGSRG